VGASVPQAHVVGLVRWRHALFGQNMATLPQVCGRPLESLRQAEIALDTPTGTTNWPNVGWPDAVNELAVVAGAWSQDHPLPWQKHQVHLTPGRAQGFAAILAVIHTAGEPKLRGKSPGWPQGQPRQRDSLPVVKKVHQNRKNQWNSRTNSLLKAWNYLVCPSPSACSDSWVNLSCPLCISLAC